MSQNKVRKWISINLYTLGYWICSFALRIRGIDRNEFQRYWAKEILEVSKHNGVEP